MGQPRTASATNSGRWARTATIPGSACTSRRLPTGSGSSASPASCIGSQENWRCPSRWTSCVSFLGEKERVREGTRNYWRGKVALKTGEVYEIVVASSRDMASVSAALLTYDTIRDWNPGAVLFVGIAARTSDKVAAGDIVVGNIIIY